VSGFSPPSLFSISFLEIPKLIYLLNKNPSSELFMLLSLEILGLPKVCNNKNWIFGYVELIPLYKIGG